MNEVDLAQCRARGEETSASHVPVTKAKTVFERAAAGDALAESVLEEVSVF